MTFALLFEKHYDIKNFHIINLECTIRSHPMMLHPQTSHYRLFSIDSI